MSGYRTPGVVAVAAVAVAAVAELSRRRLAAQLAAARHAAHHDPLTGLLNRAGLTHTWEAVSGRGITGVMVIDLDRFKPINDTYGHAAGDRVLRVIGARLTRFGWAARLGGDEFVVLYTGTSTAAAAAAAAVEAARPIRLTPTGLQVRVTASVGLALGPGPDLSAALGAADAAMYRAKTSHAPVAVYDPHRDDHPNPHTRPGSRTRDLPVDQPTEMIA